MPAEYIYIRPGRVVGDTEGGERGEDGAEGGGVPVRVVGGVDGRVAEELVLRACVTRWPRARAARSVGARAERYIVQYIVRVCSCSAL